jgi:RNA polymerase sigma factor (sigma-70 family)
VSEGHDSLTGIGDLIRHTLAAQTSDAHLVEDLAQETLVRLAATDHQMTRDEQRAYAVVTARNLLRSHGRSLAIHRRHIHRLVDDTALGDPEQLSLEREETAALAAALQRLGAEDRDLLLRHEVDGVDLASIAAQTQTTPGAIAMRLARARASLRLEFLLAFRRVELPTEQCRPVLLAFSAADRRRQDRLDAAGHLRSCQVCTGLARPITARNRRIAGWLLVPVAEGVRRGWRAVRSRPGYTAAIGIAAGAMAFVVLTPADDSADRPTSTEAPAATLAAPSTPPTPTPTSAAAPTTPTCPSPTPLELTDPASILGCPFAPTIVTATDVSTDEGFWATSATSPQALWIHLLGAGESPIDINDGQQLSIAGIIAAPQPDPTLMGLPAGGDPHLAAQPYYLQVNYADVHPQTDR